MSHLSQNGWRFPEGSMPQPPQNFNNVSAIHNFPSSPATLPQPNVQHCPPYNAPNSFQPQPSFPNMNNPYCQPVNQQFHSNNNYQLGLDYVDRQPPPGYSFPSTENCNFKSQQPPQRFNPQNCISNNRFDNKPSVQPPQNQQFSNRFPFQHPPPFNQNYGPIQPNDQSQPFNRNYGQTHPNDQSRYSGPYTYDPASSQQYPSEKPFQENEQQFNHPFQFSEPPPNILSPITSSVTQNNKNPNQKLPTVSEKERNLVSFLKKFHIEKKAKPKSYITVSIFSNCILC